MPSAEVRLQVMGATELKKRITEWSRKLEPVALREACDKIAVLVYSHAWRNVPVRTGRLRSSIQVAIDARRMGPIVKLWADAPYASYVELGTFKMAERPFLRPAVEENSEQVRALFEAAIEEVLNG